MSPEMLRDPRLYTTLQRFDEDLAREARAGGCDCVLHSATYPRKPRGGPADLGPEYDLRLSFCCAVDGCRRRRTPASVRFFGRRVYLGVVFLVLSAVRHGATADRVRRLRDLVGVTRRTLRRWASWWVEAFPATSFWKSARGRFSPAVRTTRLPASLVERFAGTDETSRAVAVLALLSHLTVSRTPMGA